MSFARILARLVRRHFERDRPLCVDCKQPIEPGRTGWTCEACARIDALARGGSEIQA